MCTTEPRPVYTHSYGHSLNLACSDAIKHCRLLQVALDTTNESTKFIIKSPAHDAIFKRLKVQMASYFPGIRVVCSTRWTVRAGEGQAGEGQVVAAMTVSTMKSLCNDANFKLFWQKVATSAANLPIDELTLPHRRKLPHRFDDGSAPTFHVTMEDNY